jgi:hypothetical protein
VSQLVFKINEEQRVRTRRPEKWVPVYARMMHEMLCANALIFKEPSGYSFAIF